MSQFTVMVNGLAEKVESINTCEELQKMKNYVEKKMQELLDDMNAQLEKLIARSVPPTEIVSTINWIKLQIETINAQITAINNEITETTTAVQRLNSAISQKIASLGCDI